MRQERLGCQQFHLLRLQGHRDHVWFRCGVLTIGALGDIFKGPTWEQHCFRRDYHRSFVQPDFRAEKNVPFLEVFCLFSCVLWPKRAPKNLHQTLVTSDTHGSLVKVLPNCYKREKEPSLALLCSNLSEAYQRWLTVAKVGLKWLTLQP